MKGGTAINLFVREMPRLSVDIDLAFTRLDLARAEAPALEHGRRLKCLTIVDDFTKEAIDIVVDHGSRDSTSRACLSRRADSGNYRACYGPIRVPSSPARRSISGRMSVGWLCG